MRSAPNAPRHLPRSPSIFWNAARPSSSAARRLSFTRRKSADRRPQHLLDVLGAGGEHDEPVKAECNTGTIGQAVIESGEEILVDRVDVAIELPFTALVGEKAGALLGRIGQFAEGVGEFEPADVDLEAFGETRVVPMA